MTARLTAAVAAFIVCSSCAHRSAKPALSSGGLPPAMYRQVVNAVNAGDGDYEIRSLRAEMTANPADLKPRLALARRYTDLGYPEIALEHARLAVERFPNSPEAQEMLARSLRRMKLHKAAAAGIESYLASARPVSPQLYSWLGIIRDEMREHAAAEQAHRKAVELNPASDSLRNNLGYNLLLQDRKQDAAAEFRAALKLNEHSEIARNNLGAAIASQPDEAILMWQSTGGPATAHNNLAVVLMEEKRYQEARKELEIALGYRRDHPAALSNLSLLSTVDGKPASAPVKERQSFWKRFAHEMHEAFVGPDEQQTSGAVKTASR
jgi:Flp pilus assembly protein TadD